MFDSKYNYSCLTEIFENIQLWANQKKTVISYLKTLLKNYMRRQIVCN